MTTNWSPPSDGVFPAQLYADYKYIDQGIPEPYAAYERDPALRNRFRNRFFTNKITEINDIVNSITDSTELYDIYMSSYYPNGTYEPGDSTKRDFMERHSATYDSYYITNGLPADSTNRMEDVETLVAYAGLSDDLVTVATGLDLFSKYNSAVPFRDALVRLVAYDDALDPILTWVDANTSYTFSPTGITFLNDSDTYSGSYTDTSADDATYHTIDVWYNSGMMEYRADFYYTFDVGSITNIPRTVKLDGHVTLGSSEPSSVTFGSLLYAYNWVSSSWTELGNIDDCTTFSDLGVNSDVYKTYTPIANNIGTGANAGKVRIRFNYNTTNATFVRHYINRLNLVLGPEAPGVIPRTYYAQLYSMSKNILNMVKKYKHLVKSF